MHDKKKILGNITLVSTILTIIPHFICCGIPAILLIIGSIYGAESLTGYHFALKYINMNYLLTISGILIVLSYIFYKRQCKACCNAKTIRLNKIFLIIAIVMYAIGLFGHFIFPLFNENAHTEIEDLHCH